MYSSFISFLPTKSREDHTFISDLTKSDYVINIFQDDQFEIAVIINFSNCRINICPL